MAHPRIKDPYNQILLPACGPPLARPTGTNLIIGQQPDTSGAFSRKRTRCDRPVLRAVWLLIQLPLLAPISSEESDGQEKVECCPVVDRVADHLRDADIRSGCDFLRFLCPGS